MTSTRFRLGSNYLHQRMPEIAGCFQVMRRFKSKPRPWQCAVRNINPLNLGLPVSSITDAVKCRQIAYTSVCMHFGL